jgi:hypothetical protein
VQSSKPQKKKKRRRRRRKNNAKTLRKTHEENYFKRECGISKKHKNINKIDFKKKYLT